jgi:hypothetical protein
MAAVLTSAGSARCDLYFLAIAQEAAGSCHHALLARKSFGDDHAIVSRAGHPDGMALDLARRVDDEHITALLIGHDCGLRQHRALCLLEGDFGTRKRTGAQRRVR